MRRLSYLVLFLVLGCGKKADPVVMVKEDDPAMNASIQKARETVRRDFVPALKNPGPNQEGHSVKVATKDGGHVEHMWLRPVSFDGKQFTGTINNQPNTVKNVKIGQQYTVAPEEISDWMYSDSGRLVGGFTIRALRDRLQGKEREEFDRTFPLKID